MYVSIDIGGTNTRIAVVKSLEVVEFEKRLAFENSHNYQRDYDQLVDTINRNATGIKAIGLGIAGDVSDDKRTVYDANNNTEWIKKPFVADLSKQFECPVFMDNDAVTASLGVAFFDDQKDWQDFAYVTWGTGIGGAMVARSGNRYESIMLSWEKHFSDWEADCGGAAIQKRFGKKAAKLSDSEWQTVIYDFRSHLITLSEDLNVETIVIGGGIADKQKAHLDSMEKIIGLYTFTSSLGDDTGLYGGLGLIKSRNFSYRFIR